LGSWGFRYSGIQRTDRVHQYKERGYNRYISAHVPMVSTPSLKQTLAIEESEKKLTLPLLMIDCRLRLID
jgi:hypothetical protein